MSKDPASGPVDQRLTRRRILLALLGIFGFGLVLAVAGLDRLPVLLEADPTYVGLAFVALVAVTFVSAIRWGSITDGLAGRRILSFSEYYTALLTSRVLGLFVSRSGSDLGVRFMAVAGSRRAPARISAASVFLDQLFDLTLLLVWVGPALLVATETVEGPLGKALLTLASVVAFAMMLGLHRILGWTVRAIGWSLGLVARIPSPARAQTFLLARKRNVESLLGSEDLSRRRLSWLAGLTFGRYLLNALMFFAVARALNLEIGWHVYVLTGALVQLSLVVAATPGGLGVMDAGWVVALGLAGVPTETTAAFLVGQRAFQYLGFPALAALSSLSLVGSSRRADEPALDGSAESAVEGDEGKA